jgi:hypothetical protein
MGEHKAVVQLVGLRHARKGSTIIEAWEIIGLDDGAMIGMSWRFWRG